MYAEIKHIERDTYWYLKKIRQLLPTNALMNAIRALYTNLLSTLMPQL